ncbi:unnamed protein product [Clonostachys rosea f. rosea IK726]|uniref:Uncharacterized protein n=1 Tax=Clonostachys rosea f. rosea IK726 TaxID=1349383 RepID=A0ACA9UQQ6_BIOOC|nr:unnamed protein product [Clonostachys rosea f. rosea IK726]
MGLGDEVSRGMCEALVRAGSGATAYISESLLQDHDHLVEKSKIMAKTIGRAPIRIRPINWGMALNSTQSQGSNDDEALGPRAKSDNLAPPKATQQAPPSGTMFWAIRSSRFAIINGTPRDTKVTVTYEVPGGDSGSQTLEVQRKRKAPGKLIHCLAARALIQTLEDKLVNTSSADERYWIEAEIVRLGKTYSLASTQTSFIATMNGFGIKTNARADAPTQNRSLLAGVPMDNTSSLSFVSTLAPSQASTAHSFASFAAMPTHLAAPSMKIAQSPSMLAAASSHQVDAGDLGLPNKDDLTNVLAAQEADGSFNSSRVEQLVFPDTGIPEIAAFICALEGRDHIKNQIWHAICVIAFLREKHGGRSSDWSTASSKAEKFANTNLCCIFGLQSGQVETILAKSLE